MNYTISRVLFTTLGALLSIGVIAWMNYQIIGSWFGKDGPANLGSIEVSYVSMGKFLTEFGLPFPGGSSWFPLWYFGFPFHLFYTPLLPFLETLLHVSFNVPLWESYRLLTGIGYILAPVSVFFLGWQLSKRLISAVFSAVLYSVGVSVFYFLDSGIAADKFSTDFLDPRRFTILVRWGEGPHIFSLIFVPLVGACFSRMLEIKKFRWVVLTSFFLSLAALSNAIGLFASILLITSMTFVKFSQDEAMRREIIKITIFTVLLAFGLLSFWYNISFITNFFGEGEGTSKMYLDLFPWGWVGFFFGVGLLFVLCNKVIRNFAIAVSALWFGILFIIVQTHYSYSIDLLPQALRYNTEADLAFSLLLGTLYGQIIGFLANKLKSPLIELGGVVLGISLVVALFFYIQPFIPVAKDASGEVVDLNTTGEFRVASWLSTHVDQKKGERVFLPGNYGFYLNYFTNVWQIRGGLFQASTHSWPDHMYYQMANGTDPEIARAWLIIANAKYAVVTATGSAELYHEMKNLSRFEQFPVAYSGMGDIIYEVPLKRLSLVKPVKIDRMQSLAVPSKGDDKTALLAYADWVENSSQNQAQLDVVNHDMYRITGQVGEGEGIQVAMTDDPGWRALRRATPQGKLISVKTGSDPMGFLILYPDPGQVDIVLSHGIIWQQWLGYGVTFLTIIVVLYRVFGLKRISSPM